MKRYLLDTGPLGAYLQSRTQAVNTIFPWIQKKEVATSIVVYGEVFEYIKSHPHYDQRYKDLKKLLREIYPYLLTYSIMEQYALIRRQLRPPYGNGLIGDMDTLIAATAIERNLTLITTDHDFERVPKLKVKFLNLKN